ncbi:hypothetical protein [Streptomyces sp. NBC_00356]|uniref:hypothetical protein n=1 Tax=Streptomyces sp. NBC_00356 TaxID=2975724 RepID=UPI002E260338
MTDLYDHEPTQFFWEAGGEHCPHGAEPDSSSSEWDAWAARHRASDQTDWICLDAPMGAHCPACTAEHNDPVPWSRCENREHARPRRGKTRQHRPTIADAGTLECLERECEDFFTEDGDEIPDKTVCSHMTQVEVCDGCTPEPSAQDEFPAVVAWADCSHAKSGAAQR